MNTKSFISFLVIVLVLSGAVWVLMRKQAPSAPVGTPYTNDTLGISLSYPDGYRLEEEQHGVKLTIPPQLALGTNLSSDSYLSVEKIPPVNGCNAPVATSNDAAAGNRYEETIYTVAGKNSCYQVHYLIHYGVFENYPAGSIKEFDRGAILKAFDAIRATLVLN